MEKIGQREEDKKVKKKETKGSEKRKVSRKRKLTRKENQ